MRMGRTKRLVLSIAIGVLAMAVAVLYGSSVRAEAERDRQEILAQYGGDLVEVCVASRDIAPGEVVDESCVRMEEWVANLLPAGAVRSYEDAIGMQATSSIPARAVICPAYFEREEGSIEVPAGKVAVSVPADDERAVGGAISPGDGVDVYVSDGGIADRLCRASVIDTSEQGESPGSGGIAWVTLAVDPENVSEVLAATATGSVSLVLPGERGGES